MSLVELIFCCVVTMTSLFPACLTGRADRRGGPHPVYTQQAIERLSRVFGIDELPTLTHSRSPPEYMMELYNSVAFSDGISKRSTPYDADVVRGFPDRAIEHQSHYYFNVSYVSKTEGVLAAELRLYKTRPDRHNPPHPIQTSPRNHLIELRLYQVLSEKLLPREDALQLLDSRRISAHAVGWQVFTVTGTIRQWVNDSDTNHGVLVTATSLDGVQLNESQVRFAQRGEHHDSKQPVLVVFSGNRQSNYFALNNDQGNAAPSIDSVSMSDASSPVDQAMIAAIRQEYIQSLNEGYEPPAGSEFPYERYKLYMTERQHDTLTQAIERQRRSQNIGGGTHKRKVKRSIKESKKSRSRRNTDYYRYPGRRKHRACQRGELYVDFDEIGWSGWIISPKGYNAFHCWGECPFPLGQFHRPTNHATVQSIVHTMRTEKGIQLPCCVPDKLYSISLLYFDDEENVILKQYDEMVAASCGCH